MDNKQCTGPEWAASESELAVAMATSAFEGNVHGCITPMGQALSWQGPIWVSGTL